MKLEQHWRFSFPLRSKESDQAVCRCAQKENPGLVWKINSGCTVFLCKAVNTLRRTLLRPWSVVQEFWGLHRHWLWLALRHQASQGSREGGGKQRRKTASGGGGGKFTVRLKQNRSVGWKITIKKKWECSSEVARSSSVPLASKVQVDYVVVLVLWLEAVQMEPRAA